MRLVKRIKDYFCKHKSTHTRFSQGFISMYGTRHYGAFVMEYCEQCRKEMGEVTFVWSGE